LVEWAVKDETDDPVNTPNTVSNELPLVSTVRNPLEDGVYEYHFVDEVAPCVVGSPASRVADVLLSFVEPLVPERTRAEEKKSLFPEVETTTEFDNVE
jgi:hypothetical protein